jgi:spore coat polysaccharide biosynthesis protein SpsF
MNIVAFIQARMASSRLPGKVLKDLGGQPLLVWAVERCRRARNVTSVVVATTDHPNDEPIVELCRSRGYSFFRGSQFDVLDRFYQAARGVQADVIVRVTADCPFIDPGLVDDTIEAFLRLGPDFAAPRLPPPWSRTYPIGLDVEVCSFAGLERAWKEAVLKHEREHVMPYFYDQEGRFRIHILNHQPDYSSLRWTVDTPEDLDLLREIAARFPGRMDFGWREILALLEREPELSRINANIQHKSGLDVDARMK